jgi:hypothetical protein
MMMSVRQELMPESIPNQKCHTNMGRIEDCVFHVSVDGH